MTFSQRETVELSRRSTARGVVIFAVDLALLVGFAFGALTSASSILQLVCSLCFGVMIALLFIVGHDAAHQSLTPHRWLNATIGRIALLPSLHPFSLWQLGHNQKHHRWTNLATHDYVWTPLTLCQFDSLTTVRKWIYRFHRSVLGPFSYYLCEIWVKRMLFPSRKEVNGTYKPVYLFDLAFVGLFFALYLAFLIAGGARQLFLGRPAVINALIFGFLLPFGVWNFLMSFVVYLHHTHPMIRWYNDEETWRRESQQSLASVHVLFPWPVNFIFHRIMEHNAHHERPSIPLYHLKAAQEKLNDDHVVLNWTPWSHMAVVRACKLYDFEACRWLDFAGDFSSDPSKSQTAIPTPHFERGASVDPVSSKIDASRADRREI